VKEPVQQANRQIARAAGTVMFAFALSQIAGLVRQILVTSAFGTGGAIDAFSAANAYPNFIFSLVAGGALASAFVPTFTSFLAKEDRPSAWRLASSVTNLVMLILTVLSLLSAVFAHQIVHIFWPNYPQALTVELLQILLITSTIFGVSGLLMGILNSHQRFLLPSLASTMYWLGLIFGLLFFVPSMGILGLAWGAVLGSILHLCIQLPDLFHLPGRHYTPTLGLKNPAVRQVALLMGPRLLSVGVIQISLLINTIIASRQPTGSMAAITYAFAIMTVPLVVIGSAIATASLPTFSTQVAMGDQSGMRQSITATLRGVILLSVPATIGLILLRQPLITLLFQHGEFGAHSTDQVSWALLWYTIGLVAHSILEILTRAFFAMHDTKTPVLVGASAMGLGIIFSFAFSAWFAKIGWMPLGGLALATSAEAAIETTILFVLLRKRLKGIQGGELIKGTGAALLGSLGMAATLIIWLQVTKLRSTLLTTIGGVAVGGIFYGIMLVILRVPEVSIVLRTLQKRIGRN
jgi:putative peptidoglycan lipid II flippase